MTPVGFQPTISAGERPKTYALDRAISETGYEKTYRTQIYVVVSAVVR
jgi:predicted trehalose synthase